MTRTEQAAPTVPWGRVDGDGTVWVRTRDGERPVGQYPGATPEQALAYYMRKYDELHGHITLLAQRVRAKQVVGSAATRAIKDLRDQVAHAHAVGDLAALEMQLDGITATVEHLSEELAAQREAAHGEALAARTELITGLAGVTSAEYRSPAAWRTANEKIQEMFGEWKKQQQGQKLTAAEEAELWQQFKSARGDFDRRRRQYFADLDRQRAEAKSAKEQIVVKAEKLASSTDWAATSTAFRSLLDQWKATARAGRAEDDALWARFRAAQDTFFGARNAQREQANAVHSEHAQAMADLADKAEALLPVRDATQARRILTGIQKQWDAVGPVPAAAGRSLEARLRVVEQAVRDAEQQRWSSVTNSQARERAENAVAQLGSAIATLSRQYQTAVAANDTVAAAQAEQAIAVKQQWLDQAKETLADLH